MGKYCDYDLHVFGPKAFYPVAWPDWKDIFKVRRENTPGTKRNRERINSWKLLKFTSFPISWH